jgi:4-carboxymuconolactone decarboxylase
LGLIRIETESRFTAGTRIRREVLGDAHVDRAIDDSSEFTQVFQEFATEYAWGTIWARPGLPRKTRSLLNIAMLTALNRPSAVALPFRFVLHNGTTQNEIAEVLLQVAVYAGVVAAGDGFKVADQVLKTEHEIAPAEEASRSQ